MPRRLVPVPQTAPRAIIYVRVSKVGGREELLSPDLQETACRDYCARRGYTVTGEPLVDLDRTGRSWSRRQIEAAVRQVEAGEVDVIVCYRWSRFSRNLRDYVVQVARVEAAGGRVEAAQEETDPATAAGLLQRDLFAVLAQWEARLKGEQWKEVLDKRRAAGLPPTGRRRPPLGYVKAGRSWAPDPDTAPLVAELYRRYMAGGGWHTLAEWLATRGVLNAETGRPFSHRGVLTYLDSGWAAGLLHTEAGEYLPAVHEPIIDGRAWESYLVARAARAKVPARLVSPRTALSGLVRCDGCGYRVWLKSDADYGAAYRFACTTRHCRRKAHVSRRRAEAAVRARLVEVAEEMASGAARAQGRASTAVSRTEIARLNREVARIDRALTEQAKQRLRDVGMPPAALAAAVEELTVERDLLDAELEKLRARVAPRPSRRRLADLLGEWDGMAAEDPAALNRLLSSLLGEVRVVKPERGRCSVMVRMVWEGEAL